EGLENEGRAAPCPGPTCGSGFMSRPSSGYSAAAPSVPQAQPVCPRRPDRVRHVRCERCERPACPDRQRAAAVGMRCVGCATERGRQQASARPRNAMGGGMGSRQPVVTYTVMGLSVLFYLGQVLAPSVMYQLLMFVPFRAVAMPWTFLTSGFLHG